MRLFLKKKKEALHSFHFGSNLGIINRQVDEIKAAQAEKLERGFHSGDGERVPEEGTVLFKAANREVCASRFCACLLCYQLQHRMTQTKQPRRTAGPMKKSENPDSFLPRTSQAQHAPPKITHLIILGEKRD